MRNKEVAKLYARNWRKLHPGYDKRKRVYNPDYNHNRYLAVKEEVLSHYSGTLQCAICEENDLTKLTIDHVNGGGNQHRRFLFDNNWGGYQFYLWLKRNNYPKGYRVLCKHHNSSKNEKVINKS